MPHRSVDAVFFVEEGPLLELRNGMFHVCYQVGRQAQFEIVLPPSTFFNALHHANQLAAEFTSRQNVVSVDFDSKFERVYGRPEAEEKSGTGDH